MVRIAGSGVVIGLAGFVVTVIPLGLFSGTNFMKWKNSFRESGTKQDKSAGTRTFRTDSDFTIGKRRKSLPEIATVGTEQGDIDARDQ